MRYLVGNSAEEYANTMAVLQDQVESSFIDGWAGEIQRAMLLMIDQYKATRSTPDLPIDHQSNMAEILARAVNLSMTVFGDLVLNQAKGMGKIVETKSFAETFARLALEYIAAEVMRQRISGISLTTRQQIIDVISNGQANGLTLDEIGEQLIELSETLPRFRAAMIARTEVHGAANYAANEAAKATGLKLRKRWISVALQPAITRRFRNRTFLNRHDEYDHRQMNGVEVEMDQPFMVPKRDGTFEPLMTPGDAIGSAGNVINCRCQVGHVVDDGFDE